jgi:hypothetical protein
MEGASRSAARLSRGAEWFGKCGARSFAEGGGAAGYHARLSQCLAAEEAGAPSHAPSGAPSHAPAGAPSDASAGAPTHASAGAPSACGECGTCPRCCGVRPASPAAAEVLQAVLKDVPRSFGAALRELDAPWLRRELTEVLTVFGVSVPQVGYTQGMNFVCAVALAHMPREHAFYFLVEVVRALPPGFFIRTALDEVHLFSEVLAVHAPVVKAQVEGSGGDGAFQAAVGLLLVNWMVPLFCHALPLSTTLQVWDFLFESKLAGERKAGEEGWHEGGLILAMHRVAFAIVEVHSGPLLSQHRESAQALAALLDQRSAQALAALLDQRAAAYSAPAPAGGAAESAAAPDAVQLYAALRESLDSTCGVRFAQRLQSAAKRDSNGARLVRLAQAVTVDHRWLCATREENLMGRGVSPPLADESGSGSDGSSSFATAGFSRGSSTSPSPALFDLEGQPTSVLSLSPSASVLSTQSLLEGPRAQHQEKWQAKADREADGLLQCVGVREKGSDKKDEGGDENGADGDDCVVS